MFSFLIHVYAKWVWKVMSNHGYGNYVLAYHLQNAVGYVYVEKKLFFNLNQNYGLFAVQPRLCHKRNLHKFVTWLHEWLCFNYSIFKIFNWKKNCCNDDQVLLVQNVRFGNSYLLEKHHMTELKIDTLWFNQKHNLAQRGSLLIKSTISSPTDSSWNGIYLLTTCTSGYMLRDKTLLNLFPPISF